ncbi:hypothetical protein [Kosakonia radicincitans]|uniref:hypothetical protein n=1 Tax=Kosakonia radicincitans TaxID=283686 RepID=UPI002368CF16|nr:hypothetical protein [Kosakonia radicincitans]MDD7997494.1 hypothetical protein [Kosakonia radicincitans]
MNINEFVATHFAQFAQYFLMAVGAVTLFMFVLKELPGLTEEIRGRAKKANSEWRYATQAAVRPDESLTDITTATYLWQQHGIRCTQVLLEALETALGEAGYRLTQDVSGERNIINPKKMYPHRREMVASALLRAREQFWAPHQSDADVENTVRLALKSGLGQKMLDDILITLISRKWRLETTRPDRELEAYPLQQVVVKITGAYDARKDDLIQCLKHLATTISVDIPSADASIPDEDGRFCTPEIPTAVRYSVTRTLCDSPPGFFPESLQISPPLALTGMMKAFNASLENHIVMILQCHRETDPEMFTFLLEKAIRKLEERKTSAVDEDDDTGYAFACQGRCFD